MNTFRLSDGRALAWREAGAGRPLVLLHGWAMSSAVFTEMLAELAGDRRVLAPDLRGHGHSGPGPGYGLADFAADLGEWIEGVGLGEFDLLGWSLGGEVALDLAGRFGTKLRRLALVSTTPRFAAGDGWEAGLPETRVRAMARDLRRDFRRAMEDFFALQFEGETLPRERYRRIVEFAVRQGSLPAPEVALAALETLRREDLRERLAAVEAPALVLHGELDRIIPAEAGACLARQLPLGTFVRLAGVGHAPFLSRPAETVGRIREFLS